MEPSILGALPLPTASPVPTEPPKDDERAGRSTTTPLRQPQKLSYLPTCLACLEPTHSVLGLYDKAATVLQHQRTVNEHVPELGHRFDSVLLLMLTEIAKYLALESTGHTTAAS